MSKETYPGEADDKLLRLVGWKWVNLLVGNIKEIVDASISDPEQRQALKNIITDKIFDWYRHNGERLSQEEASAALEEHWKKI